MNQIDNIEKFFNKSLLDDLTLYRIDIDKKIAMLKLAYPTNQNHPHNYNKIGGDDIVGRAIKYVNNGMGDISKNQKIDTDKLVKKVQAFKDHIDHIIESIGVLLNKADGELNNEVIIQIAKKYDNIAEHYDRILFEKGYRLIDENKLKMLLKETKDNESHDGDWSELYHIWKLFMVDVEEFKQANSNTMSEKINDQAKTMIEVMKHFEEAIVNLIDRYDGLINQPSLFDYEFVSKIDVLINNGYMYTKMGETGQIIFSPPRFNHMKYIEFNQSQNQPDGLSMIETNKIKYIDDYVKHINKTNNFIEASGGILINQSTENINKIKNYQTIDRFKTNEIKHFSGGDDKKQTSETPVPTIDNSMPQSLLEMGHMIKNQQQIMKILRQKIKQYEFEQERIKYYIFYIMKSASLKGMRGLNMYKYIDRGTLDYYLSIINDIFSRSKKTVIPADALYFDVYHYYTLKRMSIMLGFLYNNMTNDDLIDIDRSSGPITADFVLFNHFKGILDSYHATIQNNVTIYARINDYEKKGTVLRSKDNRAIRQDGNEKYVIIDYAKCIGSDGYDPLYVHDQIIKAKFTNVFGTDSFSKNEAITKYMSISTNISKKTSVTFITYGYSGTGKSYTLFGSGKGGDKGILQSAIEGIPEKDDMYIRIYEIYGMGVKYPFYWCQDVVEKCYVYGIDPNKCTITEPSIYPMKDIIGSPGIKTNPLIQSVGYTRIPKHKVSRFFGEFINMVDTIDKIRSGAGRIKETPNNKDSSRSIIIYDIMIQVDDDLVRLDIIDLPGREEVVQTYANNYIEKKTIKEGSGKGNPKFDNPLNRAILSSMCINPLYLAIFCPGLIAHAFNQLDDKTRAYIFTTPIDTDNTGKCLDEKNKCQMSQRFQYIEQNGEKGKSDSVENPSLSNKLSFLEEKVVVLQEKTKDGDINNITKQIKNYILESQEHKFRVIEDKKSIKYKLNMNEGWKASSKHIPYEKFTTQFEAVIIIHLLNRIVLLPESDSNGFEKFVVLSHIYKYISLYYGYTDNNNNPDIPFDAPFEGIYINENIIGMLKVLSEDKNLLNNNDSVTQKFAPRQANEEFKITKQTIRSDNSKLYIDQTSDIKIDNFTTIPGEDTIVMSNDVLNNIYTNNINSYKSQNIFLYCNPLIENVIKYYIDDQKYYVDGKQLSARGTRDVKLFYLFSNVDQDKKCVHQYKLFNNTKNLMDLIDNTNV